MDKKKKIFIGGMCSLPLGVMERQLGNMAIMIPTIQGINESLPDSDIVTTLQLSDPFCKKYDIASLDIKSMYQPTILSGMISVFDFFRSSVYGFIKKIFGIRLGFLITGEKFNQFSSSELYIDFSGDSYGDISFWGHFLKHSLDLLTLHNLEIPVVIFAQSPGPFKRLWRKILAKNTLNHVSLITLREPIAQKNLADLNIQTPIIQLTCPSWNLLPSSSVEVGSLLSREGIQFSDRLKVGINITGFNFAGDLTTSDKYKDSRDNAELKPLFDLIQYLLDERGTDVVLVPHVYRLANDGKMVQGPDGKILKQIFTLAKESSIKNKNNLHFIKNTYSVEQVKGVIGQFDLFITGRLHAGVAAMSQSVPTNLIAYSMKHYGFAELVGLEKLVVNNLGGHIDSNELINKVDEAIKNRENIRKTINRKMISVKNLIDLNFQIMKDIVEMNKEARNVIPPEYVAKWQSISESFYSDLKHD